MADLREWFVPPLIYFLLERRLWSLQSAEFVG